MPSRRHCCCVGRWGSAARVADTETAFAVDFDTSVGCTALLWGVDPALRPCAVAGEKGHGSVGKREKIENCEKR